ncbi:MAG: EGF domain-containing protein [Myxococcota bacterium]
MLSDAGCVDLDECALAHGGCSTNASCTNTVGGHRCACLPGFVGDGGTCADIDECAGDHGGCDPIAWCTNTAGGRTCTCPPGSRGDGLVCIWFDPSLSGLSVTPGTLTFDAGTTAYALPVPSGTTSVSVTASVTNPARVTLTVGGLPAQSGVASALSLSGLVTTTSVNVTAQSGATRSTAISFSRQDYLKATEVQTFANFGMAIALSADGRTLAVGAPEQDLLGPGGSFNGGAVFIFVRSGESWSQQAVLRASNVDDEDRFGLALALSADGSTLAVGAPGEDSASPGVDGVQANEGASDSGAVYVFTRLASSWAQQTYLKASSPERFAAFGWSVSLSHDGDSLAVGAPYADGPGSAVADSGTVSVFQRTAGAWAQQASVRAPTPTIRGSFGLGLALSGDGGRLAVGGLNSGVIVLVRSGAAWVVEGALMASNGDATDLFGESLSLSAAGDVLAVGAPGEDAASASDPLDNSAVDSGAAYVFRRLGTSWTQEAWIKASTPVAFGQFGRELSLSADGETVSVGANMSAAIWLYRRAPQAQSWMLSRVFSPWAAEQTDDCGAALSLSATGAFLGSGCWAEDSSSSSVNGDWFDNSSLASGAAWVFGL